MSCYMRMTVRDILFKMGQQELGRLACYVIIKGNQPQDLTLRHTATGHQNSCLLGTELVTLLQHVKTPTYTQCCTYIRKDFHKCPSNIVIFPPLEERCGFPLMSYTPSSSNSMNKFMNFRRQIIVYNVFNIVNVQTASSDIGSNEYWAASSPEVPEGFFSFLLITITEMNTISLL